MQQNLQSLAWFGAEGILVIALALVVIVDLRGHRRPGTPNTTPWVVAGLLACLAAVLFYGCSCSTGAPDLFFGMLALDPFATFFKVLFVIAALCLVVMAGHSKEVDRKALPELHAIILAMTLGMCLMGAATDLLMIYLALELVSILSYVVTGLQPTEARSREAALKYVIYGGAASGVMLYGMSLLFGSAGSTNLLAIREALAAGPHDFTLLVSLALLLGGFGYKIAAVPFHMWAPDVYEGAPTPIAAFFSVAPKAAGFAVLLRVFATFFGGAGELGSFGAALVELIAIMAIATMVVGNLGAMRQTNVKRFLAYSSIAHAGYAMMGVALIPSLATNAAATAGIQAVLLYMIFYLFMNLGAFWVASVVIDATGSEEISAFRGFGRRNPFAAVCMGVFLFSLAGIPPLAGFVGKLYLFAAVLTIPTTIHIVMVAVAVVTSVMALFYYVRIIRAMFIDPSVHVAPERTPRLAAALILLFVIPTVLFGLYWNPLLKAAEHGAHIAGLDQAQTPAAQQVASTRR